MLFTIIIHGLFFRLSLGRFRCVEQLGSWPKRALHDENEDEIQEETGITKEA